jgi:hypothetical protein
MAMYLGVELRECLDVWVSFVVLVIEFVKS